jgi:DNA uptake protein ComE-like DNA-binding protein
MKLNIEPIRSWFGFTRRERRSTFILLIIAFLVLGLRIAVPEKNIELKELTETISFNEKNVMNKADPVEKSVMSYRKNTYPAGNTKYSTGNQKRPLINLNSCDTSQLISLPGIGTVLSLRIIKYRNLLGGYASVDQLREVYGLPPETFDLIKGRVYADTTLLTRININTAGYKELSRLPYFEKYEVTAILKYKELKGRIEGISDLTDNKLIPPEKALKVRPYLDFE